MNNDSEDTSIFTVIVLMDYLWNFFLNLSSTGQISGSRKGGKGTANVSIIILLYSFLFALTKEISDFTKNCLLCKLNADFPLVTKLCLDLISF